MNIRVRVTGLLAAASLLVVGLGCPPEDDPDPPEDVEYEVQLVGENQVPSVATPADGTMDVEFEDDILTIEGTFDDLVSELTEIDGSAAHIHEGTDDEAGPILYNVAVEADDDNRSGEFSFSQELTDDEAQMFANEELYLNIHTEAYPDGELRGHLDENAPEFADVDESWGISLSGDDHLHDVETEADGWAWSVLRDDDSFVSSGAAQNLTSEVTEVTLEAAEPDEIGDVVFTYDHEMRDRDYDNNHNNDDHDNNNDNDNDNGNNDDDNGNNDDDNGNNDDDVAGELEDQTVRFWLTEDLTDDQVDVLTDGNYYINVYTEEFEDDGELRGQIEDDAGFWDNLFGTDDELDEAPPF